MFLLDINFKICDLYKFLNIIEEQQTVFEHLLKNSIYAKNYTEGRFKNYLVIEKYITIQFRP